MSDGYRGDRYHSSLDNPPMSRLFVLYKNNTETEFREEFGRYGNIEDIWIVKDRNTGENKGVAYIKFSRTSEAAKALQELNGKCIGSGERPIKVLVASSRSDGSKKQTENEQEKYIRLFVVIPKSMKSDELREEFGKFGPVESINIIKDKNTGEPKGFAYIRYTKFYHAAVAFENCPAKYKAVFAEPRSSRHDMQSSHRSEENLNHHQNYYHGNNNGGGSNNQIRGGGPDFFDLNSVMNQPTALDVLCSNSVNQDQLWRLFDIIPGLDYCQITGESGPKNVEATVVYTSSEAATYARDKLHGLEYPLGERLIVRISGVEPRVDIHHSERRSKRDSFCNVDLPPSAPLADSNAICVKRCFIVLSSNLPQGILKNVFSCFGDLIDVYLLPNKNCGYAKYASQSSANEAIETLHGAEVCGVRLKVMEAQEQKDEGRKRMRRDD